MDKENAKEKILEELRKHGNIMFACKKTGISRATFYRMKKASLNFTKEACQAEMEGRANTSDLAEYVVMNKLSKGDLKAAIFHLTHNNPRYKHPTKSIIKFENAYPGEGLERLEIARKFLTFLREKGAYPMLSNGRWLKEEEVEQYEKELMEEYKSVLTDSNNYSQAGLNTREGKDSNSADNESKDLR